MNTLYPGKLTTTMVPTDKYEKVLESHRKKAGHLKEAVQYHLQAAARYDLAAEKLERKIQRMVF